MPKKARKPLQPGWPDLLESLRRLPPSGVGGFESLAATLLSAACNLAFVVAASGSQPTGDAVATSGRSCIQAKRYRGTTALNLNDIVGNIYTALRSAPELEVYVLAVTRDTAQLRQHITEVETRTGLDVVILEAGENLSPLGALAVVHWSAIRRYFPKLPATWDTWAAQQAADANVQQQASQATAAMRDGLRTQSWLQEASRQRLTARFAPPTTATAIDVWQRINLTRAVPRPQIVQRLSDWWGQTAQPNGAVEADEGFGKTWTAAAFALQTASASAVLWLESSQWSGCDTIEALIRNALGPILPEGDPRAAVFARKALRLWRKPILLVLDGVNEHRCLDAAQKLLLHYADHRMHFSERVRILFTTRPLELRPAWDKALWKICRRITIEPFDDQELTAALNLHAQGVQIGDLPVGLLALARVPRYFHLAIRLRERLRGLGEITKPLLLFTDLLDKQASAPAFRQLYASGELRDAEQILAYLARNARTQLPSGWEVSREHVLQCFPHLNPTLVELAEGRVVIERRPDSVVVSDQHVSLGFALHILHLGEQSTAGDIKTLADELARALEPNREQDTRTEALYLALLLTCLRPNSTPGTTERLRSALLALWWNSHNANHDQARLDFWAGEDAAAYLRAIEVVFFRPSSAPTEESLIAPLARRWREVPAAADVIRPVLERWLALIYPGTFEDDSPAEATERTSYPVASTPELLRLSAVALSIISQRPDRAMLPALARCARSRHFSVSKIYHDDKPHRFHRKDVGGVLSILLRWGFGESIVAELETLAQNTKDEGLLDGYQSLAGLTYFAKLPPILIRKPKEPPFKFALPDSSPAAYRAGLSAWIAQLPNSHDHWPRLNHLGRLAAFTDLPDLTAAESTALANYLDGLGQARAALPDSARTDVEGYKDLLPWLARSQPASLGQIHASCWNYYLTSTHPDPIAWEPLVPIPADHVDALISAIASDAAVARKIRSADSFSTHFTTTVLISGNEEAWLKWFDHLQDNPGATYEAWEIIPAPFVLACVATPGFRTALRSRYDRALGGHIAGAAIPRAATYWLHVLASSIDPDRDSAETTSLAGWAAEELRVLADGDDRIKHFLRILASRGDADLLEAVLSEERLKRHLATPALAQTFGYFLRQPAARKIKLTYRDVSGQMPLNLARGFLLMASTEADLVDYARAVAEAALARAAQSSGRPPLGFVSEFSVGDDGNIEAWGLERGSTAHSHAQHSGTTALWGVDRSSLSDLGKRLAQHSKPDESLISLNAELVRQNERHENLPDSFVVMFQGSRALETWARLFPDEYLGFVRVFSEKLRRDRAHLFDLGAFAYALLRPLCRIDLALAVRLHDEFFTRDIVRVCLTGAIPAFVADLWHHSLNDVAGIGKTRSQTLADSRNDLHVLWITLAAIIGDTLAELESHVRTLSESSWGKDRALAVTFMAFTGSRHWLDPLGKLEADDPSRWVRHQAGWAHAVLKETLAARAIWDDICRLPIDKGADLGPLAARLVQLGPVLPVAARWWPRPAWAGQDAAADAFLLAFLGEWKNSSTSRGEGKIGNRTLKEFFCGVELGHDHALRMAPWWTP